MSNDPDFGAIRLCLNHSQSRLDQSMAALSEMFQQWFKHPTSRTLHQKIQSELSDLEWMLSEHFQWLTADLCSHQLAQASDLSSDPWNPICDWQVQLLEDTAALLDDVCRCELSSLGVRRLFSQFEQLRDAIFREESNERSLVE